MINKVNKQNIGCKMGIINCNLIAYADDMVIMSPSYKGLQMLLNIVYNELDSIGLKINTNKTKCMIFRSKKKVDQYDIKPFNINGNDIDFVSTFKYLGFIINEKMNDSDDIDRAKKKFYSDFNVMIRNFHFTDKTVKIFLLKQYCIQFYGVDLWINVENSKNAIKQFGIGYHKAIKKLLNLSYHESNHFACQEADMLIFDHLINKNKLMSVYRLLMNPPNIIEKIKTYLYITSVYVNRIFELFKSKYEINDIMDNDCEALIARIQYVQNHESQLRLTV